MRCLQFLADTGTGSNIVNSFKTLLELGTLAATWMLENPVMAILFVGGIAGMVFGLIKKGKRAAK